MTRTFKFLTGFLIANLFAVTAVHAAPNAELKFRSDLGLEDYQTVEYRDAQGVRIDFSTFQKKMSEFGFGIKKHKDGSQKLAVLQLQAKGAQPEPEVPKLKLGAQFPDFSLRSADGKAVSNNSLRGRYALVSFYFSECAPCVKEVPMLNAFAEKHKELGVLAVTFDSMEETKAFARKTKFSWPIAANGADLIEKVGVKMFPKFALLNPHGALIALGSQAEMGDKNDALEKWVQGAIDKSSRQ